MDEDLRPIPQREAAHPPAATAAVGLAGGEAPAGRRAGCANACPDCRCAVRDLLRGAPHGR